MENLTIISKRLIWIIGLLSFNASLWAQEPSEQYIKEAIDQQFKPLLAQYQIPGLAVAVTFNGKHYFVNYGVASRKSRQPVSNVTLFELGSVSKTFTATLAGYAQAQGQLSFTDHPAKYFPELKNAAINRATLMHLGTYTAGGLPLQFPEHIADQQDMVKYFQTWQPLRKIATTRQYSNPSIGLLGYVTALAMKKPFPELLEKTIFPQLGLSQSFVHVPEKHMPEYAWGYKADQAMRVSPGMFDAEAYGVKSSSSDMLKFLDAQLNPQLLAQPVHKAIENTHVGYFKLGAMRQGLGWEQYAYPVTLATLLQGNSSKMIMDSQTVIPIRSPKLAPSASYFNKTGSTNGFGAYIAFIPQQKIGIVMLANTNFPNEARISASYHVMEQLIQANSVK